MAQNDIRIEYMPLSSLRRWARNPKEHDLGELGLALERFGYVNPMLIDERTGRLVAGHGRLDALQQRKARGMRAPERVRVEGGEWYVPVIRGIEFEDEDEAQAYVIADNRIVERGGWNEAVLAEVLADLAAGPGLDGTGYDGDDLDNVLEDLGTAGREAPSGPEIRISPELLERHDYLVFVFDNELDWQVAVAQFGIGKCESGPVGGRTIRRFGTGRVLKASELIKLIEGQGGRDGA